MRLLGRASSLAIVLALAVACGPRRPSEVSGKAIPADKTDDPAVESFAVTTDDVRGGSEDAYVTIVTFTDLLSKECATLATTIERLRDRYPDGVLRIVVKHQPSPNHVFGKLAATVGQGVFTTKGLGAFARYRDGLGRQADPSAETIRRAALSAGLGARELDDGLERGAWTEKVERDMAAGRALGVKEPPVTFVNGVELDDVPSAEVLKDTIDVELAKAKVLEQSGVARGAIYRQALLANLADPSTRPKVGSELEDPKTVWRVPLGSSPVRGKPTALVTIVEVSEFDCAYCKQLTETLQKLRTEYGDKVRVVWKDQPNPSHARSLAAAMFARAARAQKGDAGFWDVHDKLFAAARLEDGDLELIARGSGLDVKSAMAATRAEAARRDIEADGELADDVEVRGTPQLFVNGRRLVGAPPYERLKALVDEEVKKAESLVRGGIAANIVYEWLVKDGRTGEPQRRTVSPNPSAPYRGPKAAPVLVQEFGDLESAACRQAEPMLDELLRAFPGKLRIAWRDLPASTDHTLAAEAAREAHAQRGNDGFFGMQARLFGRARASTRAELEADASEIGLDPGRLRRALDAHTRRAEVDADAKAARDAAITTTPSFVVGGYVLMGPASLPKLKRLVERVLAESPLPAAPAGAGSAKGTASPGAIAKLGVVDLVPGRGRAVKAGDTVTVHYRAKLFGGGELDSSYGRAPFTVTLGTGMAVRGWDVGLVGMKVGGRRRLTIPPELAYGNHGSGSAIPPNATLVFEIELLDVK
jgi:protein-disulfide isomerase